MTLSLDELTALVEEGEVDTVVLAIPDMQGRLQGKRFHARFFLDEVLAHGTEACNYLLAVDVDMNTVGGYAITSWESGYGPPGESAAFPSARSRRRPGSGRDPCRRSRTASVTRR